MIKKIFFVFVVFIIGGLAFIYFRFNEKLPEGSNQVRADQIAQQMMLAINDSAWQLTGAIQWTFMGKNQHLWDKERHLSRVQWGKYEVFVDINKKQGVAFKNGVKVEGKKGDKLVNKAWKNWVNDSFWLNPVSKAFDDGTTRTLVKLKDGREGLMVSYASGGSTPGDAYVWILDENNLPVSWKMWVSIIPIGGVEVPWSEWETTATGVKICTLHDSFIDLKLEGVKTARSILELTGGTDPFSVLVSN